ncbi:MAG: tetratricopeptide repeat protein [Nitrososphaerales archaeon]
MDSDLAEAQAILGVLSLVHDWNFTDAENEFKKCLTLNPSSSTVYRFYARCLAALGRIDEAVLHAGWL